MPSCLPVSPIANVTRGRKQGEQKIFSFGDKRTEKVGKNGEGGGGAMNVALLVRRFFFFFFFVVVSVRQWDHKNNNIYDSLRGKTREKEREKWRGHRSVV